MLKKGKQEIIYLLNQCVIRFERETGQALVRNTNRKNYESLAIVLSEISNALPYTAVQFGHVPYEPDAGSERKEYPFRKYDITGGQIRDALMGVVASPRPFLIDTCYIYAYGKGRQAFEQNPVDLALIATMEDSREDSLSLMMENQQLKKELAHVYQQQKIKKPIVPKRLFALIAALLVALLGVGYYHFQVAFQLQSWKTDFNLLPHTVTTAERESLEGIWLCYTGSPQARLSDPDRYHKVVLNVLDIRYKNGYFLFERYGASFNHKGFAQIESPGVVSLHSRINTTDTTVLSPRHSLMSLDSGGRAMNAISASWNFDVGNRNRIIGIREVLVKVGRGGTLEEMLNSVENAACKCKIIRWKKSDGTIQEFRLRNTLLDSLPDVHLRQLLDEHSILLKDMDDSVLLRK